MPEGDTLRRLAAKIESHFLHQTVSRSVFRHPRLAVADLSGRTLTSSDSVGKHLFCRFDDEVSLHVHLRMQGRLVMGHVPTGEEEWRRRFEISFDQETLTGVDVPIVGLVRTDQEDQLTGHLGPDVCGVFDPEVALSRLASAGKMHLGAALLDQELVAGLGNIYAVETPFICGVSPFALVETVDQLDTVLAVATALIRTNAKLGPQNTTGRKLHRSEHWVLENRARHCAVCGAALERRSGSNTPWRRRTAWCPQCQPALEEVANVDLDRVAKMLSLHPARHGLDLATGQLTMATNERVTPRA